MTDTKTILCYGDSLTWGWIPVKEGAPSVRYPYEQRWTGCMAAHLSDGHHIIEEGLCARTTDLDDPTDPRLNGASYLPSALASHLPLDLVIVMLGTNDTKAYLRRTPLEIANGMSRLVGQILGSAGGIGTTYPAPKALVVAPPPLTPMPDPWFQAVFSGGHEKTREFAGLYKAMADFMKVDFLDAGDFISAEGCDGVHFTAENNADLGKAVAGKVAEIFARDR